MRLQSAAQSLEPRRLLAAFASLNTGGVLTVNGDGAANTITISLSGDGATLIAKRGAATQSFPAASVKTIRVDAGGGDDRVNVGAGSRPTTILGGTGDDTLSGGSGNDSIDGGGGIDVADYSSRGYSFTGTLGYDFVTGTTFGKMTRRGGGETDLLSTVEHVVGGNGNDTISGTSRKDGGNYADHQTFDGLILRIDGGPGDDELSSGFTGAVSITVQVHGGTGNDHIDCGAQYGDQFDYVYGEAGDDTFQTFTTDQVVEVMDGGSGYDTFDFDPTVDTDQYAALGPNIEHLIARHGSTFIGNDLPNLIEVMSSFGSVEGRGGDDTIVISDDIDGTFSIAGGDGNDTIVGARSVSDFERAGYDTIDGGNGNDWIDAGVGQDVVRGGAGNDTLNGGGDRDALFGGDGLDLLQGAAGDDFLSGESGDDTLIGGAGNDLLDGGSGADDLFGAAGKDTADYHFRTDNLVLTLDGLANDGANAGAEHDNIRGDIENVTGGGGRDRIVGDDNANVLRGNGGNDTIYGNGGNDAITPGAGHDHVWAGAGDDRIASRDGTADSIDGGAGDDTATRDHAGGVVDSVSAVEHLA